mmetsp:Transcript_17693/g.27681  ORF Transcript_17693/g.27681 Transcript_17693/m.27681 type:complete len:292 (+) Transcript_17693:44-919(+)
MSPSNSINAMSSGSGFIGNKTRSEPAKTELNSTKLSNIHQAVPGSTHAEGQRFLTDRKGDTAAAVNKLRSYLGWRKHYCDDGLAAHLDSWSYATQLAIRASTNGNGGDAQDVDDTLKLPCPVYVHEHTQTSKDNKGGNIITKKNYIQFFPARIDTRLADTPTYALALALYIDHVLDRNSTGRVTLLIDVRKGHGWANINAFQLLPFIQSTSRLLCDLFPLRLDSCLIFPVPKLANVIWKKVQLFVGTDTRKKVCLVTGPAGKNNKVPKKLSDYLEEGLITELEERRKSMFS